MKASVVFIGCGLLYLQYSPSQSKIWAAERTDYHAWWPCTLTFCLACAFLLVAPFIPNEYRKGSPIPNGHREGSLISNEYRKGSLLTGSIPYYVFPTVGCGVIAVGFIYWLGFAKIWPQIGFTLEVERTVDEHGVETITYRVGLAFTISAGPGRLTLWDSMSTGKGKHVWRHQVPPRCLSLGETLFQTRCRCRR